MIFMASACTNNSNGPVHLVKVVLFSEAGAVAKCSSEILAREITERSWAKVSADGKADLIVEMAVEPGIGTEGFTIANNGKGSLKIIGNDENGLLYGVGKFLHTSRFDLGGFTPGTWRGTDVPKGTMRGVYFASHFRNYFETASDEELQRYLEDLSLWGANAFVAVFPMPWLTGFNDPKAIESIRKLKVMFKAAKSVGMKVGGFFGGNCMGFSTTHKELWATKAPRLYGDVLLCPSKPAALKYMKNNWAQLLDQFSDSDIKLIMYWPYDEGGCACDLCEPWGSNGYPKLCRELSKIAKEKFPDAKCIVSTWMFDTGDEKGDGRPVVKLKMDGEYAGLDKFIQNDHSWVDYILSDAHEDYPPYPLKVQSPGGLPLLNFPEISMFGQWPWGAYGANPLPNRLQKLWNQTEGKLSGGFPYTEGIYVDMNQVVCEQLYWAPKKSANETMKEYIAYEFSPDVVDSMMEVVNILEQNHVKALVQEKKCHPSRNPFLYGYFKEGSRAEFKNAQRQSLTNTEKQALPQTTERAFRLVGQIDRQLPKKARASWRWRILYLRAQIDRELVNTGGWFEGPVLKTAFEELTRIYHSDSTGIMVHVPKIEDANVRYSNQTNH
jgi:hypothetical protein